MFLDLIVVFINKYLHSKPFFEGLKLLENIIAKSRLNLVKEKAESAVNSFAAAFTPAFARV